MIILPQVIRQLQIAGVVIKINTKCIPCCSKLYLCSDVYLHTKVEVNNLQITACNIILPFVFELNWNALANTFFLLQVMSPFCELVSEICTITAMKYQPLLKRNPKNDERAKQVKLNVNLRGLLIHLHSRFLYTVSVLEVYDMLFLIRFS